MNKELLEGYVTSSHFVNLISFWFFKQGECLVKEKNYPSSSKHTLTLVLNQRFWKPKSGWERNALP